MCEANEECAGRSRCCCESDKKKAIARGKVSDSRDQTHKICEAKYVCSVLVITKNREREARFLKLERGLDETAVRELEDSAPIILFLSR